MTHAADPRDYCYDVETLANYFCCTIEHIATGTRWIYEIFDGTDLNQSVDLMHMIHALRDTGARMVGFNNVGFDWKIIDTLLDLVARQGYATAAQLHAKTLEIFRSGDRWGIPPWKTVVPQVDLYKIHHFDNVAKATSLKALEFNMRSHSVADMPVDPNEPITVEQRKTVLIYNCHDVSETIRFYFHTLPMIRFRDTLSEKYGEDFTNFNDTKIGEKIFTMRLEQAQPGICYTRANGRREPRQTNRARIYLGECILPTIQFATEPLQRVLARLQTASVDGSDTNKPEALKDLSATVRGFEFVFGAGGIHGSISKQTVRADADHELIDVDVKSYYPNLAIKNGFFPEHLSALFCTIYDDLYQERSTHKKGSPENQMLKLALNGVYGKSNDYYSPFFDPKYMFQITLNGQLLIAMLGEWFLQHPGISIIQANTDGITVKVHRDARQWFDQCCDAWQKFTRLELESVNYSAMFIRDVNNYLAVDLKGKRKRKGAFLVETQAENPETLELWWNKDWSALVVPKAVEAALIDGIAPELFIGRHTDFFDFCMRERAKGKSRMALRRGDMMDDLPQTVRYHIARTDAELVKIHPPTTTQINAGKTDERVIRSHVGWNVNVCNRIADFDWNTLDRRYYIDEAKKLIEQV